MEEERDINTWSDGIDGRVYYLASDREILAWYCKDVTSSPALLPAPFSACVSSKDPSPLGTITTPFSSVNVTPQEPMG